MEELKIIMTMLSSMQEGARAMFLFWCLKEIIIYSFCPLTFYIVWKAVMTIYHREREIELDENLIKEHERYMHSPIN